MKSRARTAVWRGLRGSRRGALAALLGLAALLVVASTVRAGPTCTDSWKTDASGAGVTGSWNDASNWDHHVVPGSSDTACISAPGSYTVTLSGKASAGDLELGADSGAQTQTLVVAGGSVGGTV